MVLAIRRTATHTFVLFAIKPELMFCLPPKRLISQIRLELKDVLHAQVTQGFINSNSTVCDTRRAEAIIKNADCRCGIKRGPPCGRCQDIAAERRRQDAYRVKKASMAR